MVTPSFPAAVVTCIVLLGCADPDAGVDGNMFGDGRGSTTGPEQTVSASGSASDSTSGSNAGSTSDTDSTTTSSADSSDTTDDTIKYDLGFDDLPGAGSGKGCLTGEVHVTAPENCAGDPLAYDRTLGQLELTMTVGAAYLITDPAVEVLYTTDTEGFEGFFTIAREVGLPDHFFVLIGDDDFISQGGPLPWEGLCGLEPGTCEPDCKAGPDGELCRVFRDDFVPILADTYVGGLSGIDSLTRIREGVCCTDEVSVCSQSATTYTLLEASGPEGTISFVFADGVAFLEERGWAHEEYDDVTGTVDLALDLCGLPQPRG